MKKFVLREPRAPGHRGDGVITAYRESALTRMLGIHEYIDDRRADEQTSALHRLMHLQLKAREAGNEMAELIADEAISYLADILDEISQCATDFAQIERRK